MKVKCRPKDSGWLFYFKMPAISERLVYFSAFHHHPSSALRETSAFKNAILVTFIKISTLSIADIVILYVV